MQAQAAEADLQSIIIQYGAFPALSETVRAHPSSSVQEMIAGSKRSYVTRRLDLSAADRLVGGDYRPKAGDVALCTIVEIGRHAHLELVSGRRSRLFVGDKIIVAFGERYATDQYHATLPVSLSACALAAAGGVAGNVVGKHAGVKRPTLIQPNGVFANGRGEIVNLASAALAPILAAPPQKKPVVITVFGSSMNAGKTTAAANIIRSLKKQNLKVAAVKLTGTGSGGDCWLFKDAGADPVLDFTDAGFASTYNVAANELECACRALMAALYAAGPDFIVCEIADGLLQQETSALIGSKFLKEITDSAVFAAGDPVAAAAGVHVLATHGYATAAICGVISASPLAAAEASRATGLRVLSNEDFDAPDGAAHSFLLPARKREA